LLLSSESPNSAILLLSSVSPGSAILIFPSVSLDSAHLALVLSIPSPCSSCSCLQYPETLRILLLLSISLDSVHLSLVLSILRLFTSPRKERMKMQLNIVFLERNVLPLTGSFSTCFSIAAEQISIQSCRTCKKTSSESCLLM
jgi:hypothetical protein